MGKRSWRRLVTGAATVLLLSGCASYEWKRAHDDTTEAFQADVKQCEYEIELIYQEYQTGPIRGMGNSIGAGLAAGFGDAIRKRNLMTMCIENKGWRKQTVERRLTK